MRVKMAAVISLDGKIKKADVPHKREWVSSEDKAYFNQLMDDYNLIVMGRKTYTSMALAPQSGKQYVVVTRNPELYEAKSASNSLEFSKSTPQQIVKKYESLGFARLLLIGGGNIYTSFLKANLVDEIDLTIEPIILGQGNNLANSLYTNIKLSLVQQSQLNERGTLLLKLEVIK